MMNDDVLDFCNPVVVQHPDVLKWWVFTNNAISLCILLVYVIIFVVLKSKGVGISVIFQVPGEVLPLIMANMNYYVCFWRSSDYRHAFMEQFNILLCKTLSKKQGPANPIRLK
ncbi:hypothetical protein ANCDUO_16292 [Ancylostoma duodenale]|uniref:Uncharacterized protein n=1 Tax=Ancylostoma duodenale TaxID=51022 RepID=A0A0C2G9B7_9BILA|nr:hypothetical protein ANCDUO_16292 [Ancylostoma duodenale]